MPSSMYFAKIVSIHLLESLANSPLPGFTSDLSQHRVMSIIIRCDTGFINGIPDYMICNVCRGLSLLRYLAVGCTYTTYYLNCIIWSFKLHFHGAIRYYVTLY